MLIEASVGKCKTVVSVTNDDKNKYYVSLYVCKQSVPIARFCDWATSGALTW